MAFCFISQRSCSQSQVVFAVVAPGHVVANLAAGAVAEAGAQQAGDMMQVRFCCALL